MTQTPQALEVTVGQATDKGGKAKNEDALGVRLAEEPLRTQKGIAAVIADGVSIADNAREASESCVQGFLSDYYHTPESWSVKASAQKVLSALNHWLYQHGYNGHEAKAGYVSTLTALVIKADAAHVFHVGDTRLYRLRAGELEPLTRDHSLAAPRAGAGYLARAMGLDRHVEIDYQRLALQRGDLFLLSSDGLHSALAMESLASWLLEQLALFPHDLEHIGYRLIQKAWGAGARDNLSCLLLRIDALPPAAAQAFHEQLRGLAFAPPLTPGQTLDGYRVLDEVRAGSHEPFQRVEDVNSGGRYWLKTPLPQRADDPSYIERFVWEFYIGQRIQSPNVARMPALERAPQYLYYLVEDLEGETLRQWIERGPRQSRFPGADEVVPLIDALARGLMAFHRREVHLRDLKPEDVFLTSDGRAKILDFGACYTAGLEEPAAPAQRDRALGNSPYAAPELRTAQRFDERADHFSLGCIAYELFTGGHPYGPGYETADSAQALRHLTYRPGYELNPKLPAQLDAVLHKMVSLEPQRRYATLSECLHELHNPAPGLLAQAPPPLIQRYPVGFWKGATVLLALLNLATLWWLGH